MGGDVDSSNATSHLMLLVLVLVPTGGHIESDVLKGIIDALQMQLGDTLTIDALSLSLTLTLTLRLAAAALVVLLILEPHSIITFFC